MEPVQGWEVGSLVLRMITKSRAVRAVTAEDLFFGKVFLRNSRELSSRCMSCRTVHHIAHLLYIRTSFLKRLKEDTESHSFQSMLLQDSICVLCLPIAWAGSKDGKILSCPYLLPTRFQRCALLVQGPVSQASEHHLRRSKNLTLMKAAPNTTTP